ncbi:RNA 3'-terminal phosphate cyclase/enolpyruvate transferase [Dactylonectria macrodidyma]|uniref:RNA 3'-terminal phosphate cyclase/enolpyruvate transferase n=1 Tax=Dactylonectria macrodidyma TaxID=307937 RepID=A0A9P9FFY3_9HYPO|nr:RNA 3'-terminal phosphate cyclase/enolpyruvate transferase [Dactylonectria macrodidyma]
MKPIEIDGRTGEGGGQVSVIITNVRGNRGGVKGGGLKSQHVTSIRWLAEATDAEVEGLSVGSKTISFFPRRAPSELVQRNIKISADSGAASTLLILQAIFPFLLFSGNHNGDPVELEVSGGTNVSFSLSYDYLDLVLLPVLEERFGIQVERRLIRRGWSLGPPSKGSFWMKIRPLSVGGQLQFKAAAPRTTPGPYEVTNVDVTMVVPGTVHEGLQNALVKDLDLLFPGANVDFKLVEDSHLETRWYILLVAHSKDGRRFGKDYLGSMPKKGKMRGLFTAQVSDKLCRGLFEEVNHGGEVDEHLQDQLICFQALCNGYSSFPRGDSPDEASLGVVIDALGNLDIRDARMRKEKNHEPFGHGSLHTRTARFVVSELLPAVEFYNKGDLVKGSGLLVKPPVDN